MHQWHEQRQLYLPLPFIDIFVGRALGAEDLSPGH
jgi:hypothetical protein